MTDEKSKLLEAVERCSLKGRRLVEAQMLMEQIDKYNRLCALAGDASVPRAEVGDAIGRPRPYGLIGGGRA